MGLAAMVIYIMFMVVPIRRLRLIEHATFHTRRGSRIYYLSVALQASLVAYMVSSFFGSVAYQFYVYYLVGYAVALRRIYEAQTGAALTSISKDKQRPGDDGRTVTARDALDSPEPKNRAGVARTWA